MDQFEFEANGWVTRKVTHPRVPPRDRSPGLRPQVL